MEKDKLLSLFDAYNNGEFSFAEIFLASGLTFKELFKFIKENNVEIRFNLDFMDNGRGLSEDVLKTIMRME